MKIERIYPKSSIQAFVSAEDRNFFKHSGIDVGAIIRAMIANIKAGRIVQGGSTITQQLAKNLFLTRERTIRRKIREMILALKIERTFDKKKILELYLNQIYLGNGAYGVEAASRVYFGKSVKDLTLEEAALLAGLPKAPSRFNPFVNPELAERRRNYVLRRMLEDGYITREEYEVAVSKPVVVMTENRYRMSDYVLDMIKEYLIEKYGDLALQGGLKIYTTIDRDLQAHAVRVLKRGSQEARGGGGCSHPA
ncbi:MAG: transglycosylase domain-containing protein [Aquificota bacterium]|nr:transglycosylase domain-containing protein [Aquificota bacterium]